RPPRRAPLLPYTTLFRSVFVFHGAATTAKAQRAVDQCAVRVYGGIIFGAGFVAIVAAATQVDAELVLDQRTGDGKVRGAVITKLDRKSTRLNSSHVKISY